MKSAAVFGILVSAIIAMSLPAPERIEWSENQKIGWEMFKAAPNISTGYAATSSTGMSQSYEIDSDGYINKSAIEVKAHFYPEYSWYNAKDTSAYLLAHEQAHFDITEIHARKLRKRIADYPFSQNAKEEIKSLYNRVEQERKQMQRRFDSATNHSRNSQQEMLWRKEIKKVLEKYWVYAP